MTDNQTKTGDIMAAGRYAHSGMGNGTYGDIPADSEFHISGMGNVTINEKCGRGAKIIKSGMGALYINGDVGEDVVFKISGMGVTTFAKRPPQSVISNISKSGMVSISMPGGFEDRSPPPVWRELSFPGGGVTVFIGQTLYDQITTGGGIVNVTKNGATTSYRGNSSSLMNGQLYIDGIPVTPDDPRIIRNVENQEPKPVRTTSDIVTRLSSSDAPRPSPAPAIPFASEKKQTPEDIFLKNCSTYTKQYIDGFTGKKSHTDIVADLKLSDAELELFNDKCIDLITYEIINRPVVLNERVYDLKTVLDFKGTDPVTGLAFEPRDITPSRTTVEEFEKIVKKITSDRAEYLKSAPTTDSSSTRPST